VADNAEPIQFHQSVRNLDASKRVAIASARFARYEHQRTAADLRSVFHKHLDFRGAENILFENAGI
jgi:hypothetical protein